MIRRISQNILLIAVMLLIDNLCFAAGQPVMLKSDLDKPDKIWVGQQVVLNVTLFTTSSFSGDTHFDLPKDSGMVTITDDTHPVMGSKTIDGVSYIFKQYTISLFPLRAGTLAIPSFQVEFGYQGDNGEKLETSLPTTAQLFTALDVPGRDPEIPLITAADLKVDDRWNPEPGKATVGDAFTRTITMTATGLPGMAFPPLKMEKIEGLAIYPRQPQVSTDTERGAFNGKRVEDYSCVCQKAGKYILPELKIQWWNPTGEVLQVVKLSSVTFQVTPNPVLESSAPFPWRGAVAAVLIIGAAALPILLRRGKKNRSAPSHEKTEKAIFTQFKLAAESNDAAGTMRTLIQWLDASGYTGGSGGVSDFVRMIGDPELEHQLTALEASLYSKQKKSWSGKVLHKKVADARQKFLRHRHIHLCHRYPLGRLNPQGRGK